LKIAGIQPRYLPHGFVVADLRGRWFLCGFYILGFCFIRSGEAGLGSFFLSLGGLRRRRLRSFTVQATADQEGEEK
jgi:hypothetical protein